MTAAAKGKGAKTASNGKVPAAVGSKGKGKQASQGSSKQQAIAISTTTDEDDDEDEFEEVAIPSTSAGAAPITPSRTVSAPGTPASRGTALTGATTPADMTAESGMEGYEGYDMDESEEEDDGVIRVEIGGETPEAKAKRIAMALRKKPMTSKDRAIRLDAHKVHLAALVANARIRNSWSNDQLLKCRLLSLLPHPLVTAFSIPPSRFPDRAQRSRLFFEALQSLVTWWSQSFFDIPEANTGVRTRPWDEVQEVLDKLPRLTRADMTSEGLFTQKLDSKEAEKAMDAKLALYEPGANGERLRSINSLMKRAVLQNGSRDVSAILFVSLCRACGLGTRLVVNLQAVPWRAEKVVPKKMSGETKGGRTVASRQGNGEDDEDDDSMEEVPIPDPTKGLGGPGAVMDKIKAKRDKTAIRQAGKRRQQDPADVYRLKKPKLAPQTTGGVIKKTKPKLDLANQPPVMWAEVFSRADQRWIPVDPMRGTIRKKNQFEPASDNGPVRMAYVLAFEEDGYAREVTLRYTKSFGAKTSKLRVPSKKDEPDWWEALLGSLTRPYRLNRDELEDAELETSQVSEAMPLHLSGFKDHPIFVLERHLKREEVIQPKREVGKFRGESVYRRANVHSCKTAENWMRVGRKVKHGQDPMKWVKQRAMTLNRRREVELAKQNGEEQMQGLYAEWQTEVFTPPPIVNGHIPQNAFGNIDLYAPTMLPAGATHLPYKGIAKIAKALGISYAEACTGFEFKKQRAIPVITGIVVATENTETTMAAYKESAAAAEERERRKREEKALKRWAKLINGLRVRERLRDTYGEKGNLHETSHNPLADPSEPKERKTNTASVLANAQKEAGKQWEDKQRSASRSLSPELGTVKQEDIDDMQTAGEASTTRAAPVGLACETEDEDDDDDMEEVPLDVKPHIEVKDYALQSPPAEEAANDDADDESTDAEMDDFDHAPIPDETPSLTEDPAVKAADTSETLSAGISDITAKVAAAQTQTGRTSRSRPNARLSAQSRQTRQAIGHAHDSLPDERPPERVQPRRAARQVKAVDNPYEESSEDEEKAYPELEGAEEEESGLEEDGEQDPLQNDVDPGQVDESHLAQESTPRGQGTEVLTEEAVDNSRPVRSIRLKIKPPVKPEPSSTSTRATRSSKRKR